MSDQLQPEEPDFDLAEAVRRLSEGMDRLLGSGLNRTAIVVLLRHHTGVGKREVELVLDGLTTLAGRYTVPQPGKKK